MLKGLNNFLSFQLSAQANECANQMQLIIYRHNIRKKVNWAIKEKYDDSLPTIGLIWFFIRKWWISYKTQLDHVYINSRLLKTYQTNKQKKRD